jgi:hypothetical protein
MRRVTLIRALGLTFIAISVGALLVAERPEPAGAIYETGYTLPFYAKWRITCDYGVSYEDVCGVDLPGTHQGVDYSLGDEPGAWAQHWLLVEYQATPWVHLQSRWRVVRRVLRPYGIRGVSRGKRHGDGVRLNCPAPAIGAAAKDALPHECGQTPA